MTIITRGEVLPPYRRVHVTDPRAWAFAAGTDYWFMPSPNTALITGGTAGQVLSEYGWTTTALSFQGGDNADFLSAADYGSPNAVLLDASGDILLSPFIFGNYDHALMASQILGYMPTRLTLECRAAFTTVSANENQTAFGFLEGQGTASVQTNHLAAIYASAATFSIDSDSAVDNGAAKDQAAHLWKIVLSGSTTEWFMDGVSQGSIPLKNDEFPVAFFAHTLTTNRIELGWVHIYYE